MRGRVAVAVGCALCAGVFQVPDLQQARELFAADRFEEAARALGAVLAAKPDHAEARLLMGRTLLVLGELAEAETHLVAAGALATRERFMVPHTRALIRLRLRQWTDAETLFTEAIGLAPLYAGSRIGRAQARAFQGRLDEALADLAAVDSSPRPQPAARLLAGELLLARGDTDDAFAAFREVVAAEGEGTPAAENAAMYLGTLTGTPAETEARILRGMTRVLARAAPYYWLAIVRLGAGERAGALRALRLALAIDDLHAPSWLALRGALAPDEVPESLDEVVGPPIPGLERGMSVLRARLEEGEIDEVITAARRLLAAREGFVPAHLLLVEAARRRDDALELLDALAGLAGAFPDLPSTQAELALVARDAGALGRAESAARHAAESLPDDGSIRFLLGTVLAAAGRAEEAIAAFRAAAERGLDTAALHVALGNTYQSLQRIPEAIAELERAVQLDPAAVETIAGFALAAISAEDAARTIAILEQALAARPDSPNALYALASLYQRTGRPEQAAAPLERLLALAPGRAEVHYNLALAYRRLGRQEEAAEQTRRFEQAKAAEAAAFEQANATYRSRTEAVAALSAGEPERAVKLLGQVTGSPGWEPSDRVLLASALMAAGRPEDAAEEYARALADLPYAPGALCGAAAAAAALRHQEEVARLRRRIQILGAECPH